jgi:hypothetical protein
MIPDGKEIQESLGLDRKTSITFEYQNRLQTHISVEEEE